MNLFENTILMDGDYFLSIIYPLEVLALDKEKGSLKLES